MSSETTHVIVDVSFFHQRCLDVCAFLRNAPEGLRLLRDSGLLQDRLRDGQLKLLKEFPPSHLDPATIAQRIEDGTRDMILRQERAADETMARAGYVYAWALCDDLIATLVLGLSQKDPTLISPAEGLGFPRWKRRQQLALFRRIGFDFKPEWMECFREVNALRNRAAHRRHFEKSDVIEAHNRIGNLATYGMQCALVFCHRFRIPFRFFFPFDSCKGFQVEEPAHRGEAPPKPL